MAPQYTLAERNWLMLEFHKRRGKRDFYPSLIEDFQLQFPGARVPAKSTIRAVLRKQEEKGTVLNCNAKSSPGDSNSGRRYTVNTPANRVAVKTVLDRDKNKRLGDATVSPVSSARRNVLGFGKSSYNRMTKKLNYHPFKVIHRHKLLPRDLPRRLQFCNWLRLRTDEEMGQLLVSDEANFQLNGNVNTQNTRRYAELKTSDREDGGRPDGFEVEHTAFDQKVMVFCGMKRDGPFGLTVYRNQSLTGPVYKRLLSHTVLPELRLWNGGNLNDLWWQQDGAPSHVTHGNMRYIDRNFQERVLSRKPIRGLDWPARSPDLNPCDFCLWGVLKSKVYTPRPATLDDLEANIRREVAALDPEMMRRAIMDMRKRAELCIAAGGDHFEK